MTGFIILVLGAAVLWLIVRRNDATDRLDRLDARLHTLEFDMARLKPPQPEATQREAEAVGMAESSLAPITVSQPIPAARPLAVPPILPKPEVAPRVDQSSPRKSHR
jgi:hypothetical protein